MAPQQNKQVRRQETLQAHDLTLSKDGLLVHVRSSKTSLKSAPPADILVAPVSESPFFPVAARKRYVSRTRPIADGPAFVNIDGSPLTARAFNGTMRLALTAAGHPAPAAVTAHSLCRGGAQACALIGTPLATIKQLGNWRSDAVHLCVPKNIVKSAPKSLVKILWLSDFEP